MDDRNTPPEQNPYPYWLRNRNVPNYDSEHLAAGSNPWGTTEGQEKEGRARPDYEYHDYDDIRPSDSVSRAGSQRSSDASSRSARSARAAAITKEIQLSAQATILRKEYQLKRQKEEAERRYAVEQFEAKKDYERLNAQLAYECAQMKIQENLQAAQAITQVYDSELGSTHTPPPKRFVDTGAPNRISGFVDTGAPHRISGFVDTGVQQRIADSVVTSIPTRIPPLSGFVDTGAPHRISGFDDTGAPYQITGIHVPSIPPPSGLVDTGAPHQIINTVTTTSLPPPPGFADIEAPQSVQQEITGMPVCSITNVEEMGINKKGDPLVALLDRLVEYHKESTLPTPDIDTFDGTDLLEFPAFIRSFEMLVEEGTSNPKKRLELLLKFTKGEAYDRIKDCILLNDPKEAYDSAVGLLRKDYGDPILLATAYKSKAKSWSPVVGGDPAGLRKFSIFIHNCSIAKQASKDMDTMDSHEFLHMLALKLPLAIQQQWMAIVGKLREKSHRTPKLDDFRDFVSRLSRNENDPRIKGLGYQGRTTRNKQQHGTPSKKHNAFAAVVNRDPKTVKNNGKKKENKVTVAPCLYCGENTKHALLDCKKFAALSMHEKSEACKRKGLCFGCLNKGHMKRTCPNIEWAKCSKCSRNHNIILHDPNREAGTTTNSSSTTKVTTGSVGVMKEICAKTSTNLPTTLMTIIPVLVKAAAGSEYISTYAFMDNGCGAVFADSELQRTLKTKVRSTKLLLKTMNLEEMFETKVMVDNLQVGNIDGDSFVDLPSVFIKDSIPVTMADAPTQEDLKKWQHLRHIKLPQLTGHCIPRVTLMIGSNVPAATTPLETAYGKLGSPYAIRTPLGWLVYGLPGKMTRNEVNVNFCRIDNLVVQTSTEHLEEQFQKYITMDFNERMEDNGVGLSMEDQKFLNTMDTAKYNDNHYVVPLPFRDATVKMPDNVHQATVYARQLRRRLSKDEQLHEEYTSFMENLMVKGYAEQVPESEIERNDGKCWYIPHHPVRHPKKKKIRVVFNCPASYQGTSLNSILLQGPDLTSRLIGVLLRWRQENIGVMADIQEMFYQVRVEESDCDMLRFLWWENGDLRQDPVAHRMLVHVFGAVSSPSCANFILQKTALDNELKYGRQITNAILTDFYVDDFLKSFRTEDEAIDIVHRLKECLANGGFRLHKWISNNKRVIDSVPKEERSKEVNTLDLSCDSLPTERALGLKWDVEEDTLGFTTSQTNKKITRRGILSVMSSIYDPLGFVSPFTLRAKIILQELCREGVSWDEEIPDKYIQQWELWLRESNKLNSFKIDRCYKPSDFDNPIEVEIHHFADASEVGYGVVSYIRFVNGNGKVHCAFLMAKARVTPVKMITIPRLELNAATTAVKINRVLEKELQIPVNEIHYWTDSQTVLRYIHNEKSRFHTFVSNRLQTIREGSKPSQWHYVKSEENPADCASRGKTMTDLLEANWWLQGPQFLWSKDPKWPTWLTKEDSIQFTEGDPEIKASKVQRGVSAAWVKPGDGSAMQDEQEDPVSRIIAYYSDWKRLKRSVAWWLRLKKLLQMKAKGQDPRQSKYLTCEEIQEAEKVICRHVQQSAFHKEISALSKPTKPDKPAMTEDATGCEDQCVQQIVNRLIPKTSGIVNLDPELHNGILRVGGRLRNSKLPQNAKHQIILPKDHHISTLIVKDVHEKVGHQGKNHVLAEIRQNYWILNARTLVKSVLHKCSTCRRYRANSGKQKMADLPESRVMSHEPAFSRTGIDYFGPFEIKQGRTTRKRYGVIFSCFNSRAIHIEIAHSLDTSSCIDAIRRFIARRGSVKELYSDNGTNLVGAEKELRKSLQELNQQQATHFCANRGIEWHFNVPGASHHGGVWERQIRTIRKILTALLQQQNMKSCRTDEQLNTLMCEVESIVNSRPLTRTSSDPDDLEVLRPQDLLVPQATANSTPGLFNNPKEVYAKNRWRQMQYLADLFWKRWLKEYLPELQQRQRWLQPTRNIAVGDIVLILDDHAPRNSWPMGKVQQVNCDQKGFVRSAQIKTQTTILNRPITKLCLLLEQETKLENT